MGSNIHFKSLDGEKLRPFPPELDMLENSNTLPRYTRSYEFMKLLWEGNSTCISDCELNGRVCSESYHCCEYYYRPINFIKLREDANDLPKVFHILIDYLESTPNAVVEYD